MMKNMGKKKINTEGYIVDNKKRQITFCKRSNGVVKKLLELHHLCGTKIFSIILSETGKMIVVNTGNSPSELINKYNTMKKTNKIFKEVTTNAAKQENESKLLISHVNEFQIIGVSSFESGNISIPTDSEINLFENYLYNNSGNSSILSDFEINAFENDLYYNSGNKNLQPENENLNPIKDVSEENFQCI